MLFISKYSKLYGRRELVKILQYVHICYVEYEYYIQRMCVCIIYMYE